MSTNPLHPYLPKLKEGTDDAVMVPHELRKWDDRQAKTRLGHLANAIEVPSGVESEASSSRTLRPGRTTAALMCRSPSGTGRRTGAGDCVKSGSLPII